MTRLLFWCGVQGTILASHRHRFYRPLRVLSEIPPRVRCCCYCKAQKARGPVLFRVRASSWSRNLAITRMTTWSSSRGVCDHSHCLHTQTGMREKWRHRQWTNAWASVLLGGSRTAQSHAARLSVPCAAAISRLSEVSFFLSSVQWLREKDLHLRPPGYEPGALLSALSRRQSITLSVHIRMTWVNTFMKIFCMPCKIIVVNVQQS